MKPSSRIIDQLRRNFVALVSLVVAVTSLAYNTWRNEASEHNRNQRALSIEVLRNVSDLQQVVFHNTWDMDVDDKGNPRTGWVHVLAIHNLAQLLDGKVAASADALHAAWEVEWSELRPKGNGYGEVMAALEAVRGDTHALLRDLN